MGWAPHLVSVEVSPNSPLLARERGGEEMYVSLMIGDDGREEGRNEHRWDRSSTHPILMRDAASGPLAMLCIH